MDTVEKNLFSVYKEIDGAFAYLDSPKLEIINENDKHFKVSKTIKVSSLGKK